MEKLVLDFNIKVAASPYANCLDNLAIDEIAHYEYFVITSLVTYRDEMFFLATTWADGVVDSQIIPALNCKKPMLIMTNLLKVEYLINVAGDEREEDVANTQTTEDDKIASPDMTDYNIEDHEIRFFGWVWKWICNVNLALRRHVIERLFESLHHH